MVEVATEVNPSVSKYVDWVWMRRRRSIQEMKHKATNEKMWKKSAEKIETEPETNVA